MTYSTPALKRLLFYDFSPLVLLWFQLGHINTENNPVNFLSVHNHISNWCLTTQLCWKPISVRHEWTNPVWRFLGWGDALRYLMYSTLPLLEFVMRTQVLLNWWDDSLSRYRIHFWMAAFGDYPRGALRGLGRTVIFRPIKSGVQVCGIIQWPWYFQRNNSLLPTLKIAGCWKSHYNHPSLQWKSLTEGGKITVVYKWGWSILPTCLSQQFCDFICPNSDKESEVTTVIKLLKKTWNIVCGCLIISSIQYY